MASENQKAVVRSVKGTAIFDLVPSVSVERFARDWRAVAGEYAAEPVLVALSGGADSSALLLLFAALGDAVASVRSATVDHGLRVASAVEAAQAGRLAQACGVPHSILSARLPERVGGTANVSARARALRYRLLEEHAAAIGARWIVTAHHADDQLETMAMRLARGAGLRGLSGIRAVQGRVARPLLGWRRAELATLAAACGVDPVDDPSNADDRYDRARVRKALAAADWLDPLAAVRSAGALAQAEEALAWATDRAAAERCLLGEGAASVDATGLPAEIARRLVERCLRHVDPGVALRGADVGRLLDRLAAGGTGTLGGVRCAVDVGGWTFRPAPPHRRG